MVWRARRARRIRRALRPKLSQIQKLSFLVSIKVMKWTLQLQSQRSPLLLLGLGLAVLANISYRSWMRSSTGLSYNPQDFYVWTTIATNQPFSSSFRYDPRAADEWLFHVGASLYWTSSPGAQQTTR
jgi:hypothetical protein